VPPDSWSLGIKSATNDPSSSSGSGHTRRVFLFARFPKNHRFRDMASFWQAKGRLIGTSNSSPAVKLVVGYRSLWLRKTGKCPSLVPVFGGRNLQNSPKACPTREPRLLNLFNPSLLTPTNPLLSNYPKRTYPTVPRRDDRARFCPKKSSTVIFWFLWTMLVLAERPKGDPVRAQGPGQPSVAEQESLVPGIVRSLQTRSEFP
jgi:hypothetical protein